MMLFASPVPLSLTLFVLSIKALLQFQAQEEEGARRRFALHLLVGHDACAPFPHLLLLLLLHQHLSISQQLHL